MSDETETDDVCTWEQKWREFNAWTPGCQDYLSMYGKPPTAVPLTGMRFCGYCGKVMRLATRTAPAPFPAVRSR